MLKQFKLICQSKIPREMNIGWLKPFIVDHVHDQLSSSLFSLENFVCRNRESILKDVNCRQVTLEWFSIQILVNFETLKLLFPYALKGSSCLLISFLKINWNLEINLVDHMNINLLPDPADGNSRNLLNV